MSSIVEYEVATVPCTWSNRDVTDTFALKMRYVVKSSFLWFSWTKYSSWNTVLDATNRINWWSYEEAVKRIEWIEKNGVVPSKYHADEVHAIADRFIINDPK